MKFIASLSALAAVASVASAQGGANTAGAAYFITNEDKNFVVSHRIAADGTVKFARAISTRGRGSAGVVQDPGADPLFTQDSVKVGGTNLYTVNAGSNTITMFEINQDDPTRLKMVGNPVSSGGEFPVSVAFSEAKNMVCALNGGNDNGVNCYTPDPELGLIAIPNTRRSLNITQTTPPSGPAGSVSDIVFSQDSSKLIVSVKGIPPQQGFIAAWDVTEDGLSADFLPSTPAEGGALPFSLTLVNGKNALLATDPAAGFSTYNLDTLDAASQTPASSIIVPVEGQGAICWSNFSPKTGTYFLTDIATSIVTEVDVTDDLNGTIVKQYPLATGSSTIDNAIASFSDNDFLYVLSAGTKSIDVLALNSAGGATPMQTFNFGEVADRLSLPVDTGRVQGMAVFVKSA